MPEKKYFIDAHCHFFNINNVPVFNMIERVNLNLARLLAIPVMLVPFDLNKIKKIYKKFFTFFEKEISSNISAVANELKKAGRGKEGNRINNFDKRYKILTPLIMDFEKSIKHEKLKNQVDHLMEGIKKSNKVTTANKIKILPFLGLDLRRFEDDCNTVENVIVDYVGQIKTYNERKIIDGLVNGDVIGIKLYPSLGFDPFPEDGNTKTKYIKVYKKFNELKLPITIHCQKVAFKCGEKSSKVLIRYTNPKNWEKVLASPDLNDLRINLAHFGGESGVKDTIRWNEEVEDEFFDDITFNGINTYTWTFTIIKLLKKYKNVYSDISAFDFKDESAVLSLAWILCLDHNNYHEFHNLGEYKLIDKLMWGSDYPMMLPTFKDYDELFEHYIKAIDVKNIDCDNYESPKDKYGNNLPQKKHLLEKMIDINPKKFLFDI